MSSSTTNTPQKEDPFLKSLNALKQVLRIDDDATPSTKRPANSDAQQQAYEQREEYKKTDKAQKLQIIQLEKRAAESTGKAEKERALRASLERSFEQLSENRKELNAQLEAAEKANEPLESEIVALKTDTEKQKAAFAQAKAKADQETKGLAAEKEAALKKQDESGARLLGAQKLSADLQAKLSTSLRAQEEAKANHAKFAHGLKAGNVFMAAAMEGTKAIKDKLSEELATAKEQLVKTQKLLEQASENTNIENKRDQNAAVELDTAKTEINELGAALDAVTEERDAHKAAVETLKNKTSTPDEGATADTKQLKAQLSSKDSLVDQQKKLGKLLQSKVARLVASETSLKKQLEEAQSKDAGAEVGTSKSLDEEISEVRDELNLAEQEVRRCRSRIEELEKQVADGRKDKAALQQAREEIASLTSALGSSKKRDRGPDPEPEFDDLDMVAADYGHLADAPSPKKPRGDDDDDGAASTEEV